MTAVMIVVVVVVAEKTRNSEILEEKIRAKRNQRYPMTQHTRLKVHMRYSEATSK
jgi:hypothetical protein